MQPDKPWKREEIIGDCRLLLGDCLEILPHLGKVDAVVTDPPYELWNNYGTSDLYGTRRMQFGFDKAGVTDDVVVPAIRMAINRSQAFHAFCDPEQFERIARIARAEGFTAKPFVRVKKCPPPPMPGNWWPSGFELAIYGYKQGAWFGDESGKRVNVYVADGYRHGIRAGEKVDHPTQKWLPMIEYLVGSIVPPSGRALDPFMGSGTTGVACVRLGRKFIGIEIEPKYFEIACERIRKEYAQGDLFRGDAKAPKPVQMGLIVGGDGDL